MKSVPPLAALAVIAAALPAHAQRALNIQARTAGEFADLCAANPKEPQGDAKINFCHGLAQGAITVELRHSEGKRPFCPPPSRTETMGEFVKWVRAMPDRKSTPAVEGFFQFLGERYPCK
jgi:hypothetical protein